MSLTRRLLALLPSFPGRSKEPARTGPLNAQDDVLVRAHGDWIALLATVLEREGVVSRDELARLLAEFAAVTAADRPAEGRILAHWASSLQGAADDRANLPSLH